LDNGDVLDGSQIFSINIQCTPTSEWQLKFFGCPKGHGGDDYFFKNDITCPPPPPLPFWQPKNFNRHMTYPHCQMVTKLFYC